MPLLACRVTSRADDLRTPLHSPLCTLPRLLSFCVVRLLLALLVLSAPSLSHAQSTVTYTALTNDQPVSAYLPANATAYFTWNAPAVSYRQQTALISVAASIGSPSLYVSLSQPLPSASSNDYAATWRTGGVVSIMSSPPYTAYVAVQSSAYSRCNFTVTVTAYDATAVQSTPIPLTAAQPLASQIAAGEYRYYTYNVTAGTASMTVALTQSYGQSYLLLNSPNNTRLPAIAQAQYSSSSAAFPLVALSQPANGTWTIGVWSSQSSAFAIIAVDSTDTLPMELGVLYPGYVQPAQYSYYSVYIDAALLAATTFGSLTINVNALSGDPDLYCSYATAQPTTSSYQWQSTSYGSDVISVPLASVQTGTLYCGVFGNGASSYTIIATFGSDGVVLTPGESTEAELDARSTQLYSLVFPAGNSLITLSVTSDVGGTQLYIGAYGDPPTLTSRLYTSRYGAVQLLSFPSSWLCGDSNSLVIPGSSPPLCQLQVLVTTQASGAAYRITATPSGEYTQLTPGIPMEGVISSNQSAYLSIAIPSDLFNVTLLVTITNGASNVNMTVGTLQFGALEAVWRVSQQPGSDTLALQLDYNSQSPYWSPILTGQYAVLLTIPPGFDTATFSAVYTLNNLTSSVIELLDGVPQASVATDTSYDFYYFHPPADGWPYQVTISLQWTSEWGVARAVASNGPSGGPTQIAPFGSPNDITITPASVGVCNPLVNATCGYGIRVQRQYPDYGEYTITVTSGIFVRSLNVGNDPPASSVMSSGGVDYWASNVNVPPQESNQQVLIGLTVTSGVVTVLGSNVTSAPNASTAQYVWSDMSSTAVLSFPLVTPGGLAEGEAQQYLSVLCVTTDGSSCQYALQAQQYADVQQIFLTHGGTSGQVVVPTTLLIPAGGIVWTTVALYIYVVMKTLKIEAQAMLGTPQLYASCISWNDIGNAPLPNETSSTWNATTAPLAIELASFNATTAGCAYQPTIAVGVRAAGGQTAMVNISAAVAGGVRQLYDALYVSNTPTFPTSYYQFTLTAGLASFGTVLAFTLSNYYSPSCSLEQLQMAVSDTVMYPDPSNPSTYNITSQAVQLASGWTDFSIAIGNWSQMAGLLHTGNYYVAVRGITDDLCQFVLRASTPVTDTMRLKQPTQPYISWNGLSYSSVVVPYNTTTTIGLQMTFNTGMSVLYVGVNSVPSTADPSSYLLAVAYNTTKSGTYSHDQYVAQPITIPASACSSSSGMPPGQSCTIWLVGRTNGAVSGDVYLLPMSSNGSIPLTAGTVTSASSVSGAAGTSTVYQLSLPATPVLVSVSVNSTRPVSVQCSYQYVAPTYMYNDWTASNGHSENPYTAQLPFVWNSQQWLLNPNTSLAAAPTVCYCTLQWNSNGAGTYNISYSYTAVTPPTLSSSSSSTSSAIISSSSSSTASTTALSSLPSTASPTSVTSSSWSFSSSVSYSSPLSSSVSPLSSSSSTSSSSSSVPFVVADNSSSSGLSSGALAAAVVVPIVVVLVLVAVLLSCVCRSGVCLASTLGGGSKQPVQFDGDSSDASVAELSSTRLVRKFNGKRLLQQEWKSSDTA